MSRITISDVSREAGVSIKTVSRVLNGEPNVRDETRARVQAVATRLKYRPSVAARALAGRRSFQIGLLSDAPSPYYEYEVRQGAWQRAEESGFRLLFQPCDAEQSRLVGQVLDLVDQTHVDGVVLTPPITEHLGVLDALEQRGVPYVRIAPAVDPDRSPSIRFNDVAAACSLTEHLLGLGHRDIAFVEGHTSHPAAAARLEGFKTAMRSTGNAIRQEWIVAGSFSFEGGRQAGAQLLAKIPRPTAVFAANDDSAAGVCVAARELGLRIPQDLSVVGFDDSDAARLVWPQITTIRQPSRQMAFQAVSLLLAWLSEDEACPRHIDMAHELVRRASASEL